MAACARCGKNIGSIGELKDSMVYGGVYFCEPCALLLSETEKIRSIIRDTREYIENSRESVGRKNVGLSSFMSIMDIVLEKIDDEITND